MSKGAQIQTELAQIKGGDPLLRPAAVVEWARSNADSALHGCFEWDDNAAAHQYRIWQARTLISLHIITDRGERKSVSLSIDRKKDGGGYRDVEDVMREPGLRNVMLQDALLELRRVRNKYQALKELARVFDEIDKADKKALEAA